MTEQMILAQSSELTTQARNFSITNSEAYELAGQTLKQIKHWATQVKDLFAEPKRKADEAHKSIVKKEKSLIAPLNEAELIIKRKMTDYDAAQRAKQARKAEELRRLQQIELERLLNDAATAESQHDAIGAESALAMAQMVQDMPQVTLEPQNTAAVEGISKRRTWKARVIDAKAIPFEFAGLQLLTVNESALNMIARNTKGTAQIPGVVFELEETIAVR